MHPKTVRRVLTGALTLVILASVAFILSENDDSPDLSSEDYPPDLTDSRSVARSRAESPGDATASPGTTPSRDVKERPAAVKVSDAPGRRFRVRVVDQYDEPCANAKLELLRVPGDKALGTETCGEDGTAEIPLPDEG